MRESQKGPILRPTQTLFTMSNQETTHGNPRLDNIKENTTIQQALGPLITEFRLL